MRCPVYDGQELEADDPIRGHVRVSVDGTTVLIRNEGYREVKMVSVSEVRLRGGQELGEGCLPPGGPLEPALPAELARRRVMEAAKVTSVNDGAEWPWDLAARYPPAWRAEILGWPHAMQNLSKAADAAWGEGAPQAQAWLVERETELWEGRVLDVQIALERLPPRRKVCGRAIRQVKEYVARHQARMDYRRFREEGRPIGSGTVESAAKNVVGRRLKRGGQSWSRAGCTWMLAALGEIHSGRWREACSRLAKAA